MTHSNCFRANRRIAYVGENWIRVLDQKFSVGHDKVQVLTGHPSRPAEQAVGSKSVKFRREILVKDTHLGNLSIQIVFRAMRLLLQIVLKMLVMCQSFC